MDCRKPLFVALWLVGGLAGCTTTNPTSTTSVFPTVHPGQLDIVPITKAADLPKRTPRAKPA